MPPRTRGCPRRSRAPNSPVLNLNDIDLTDAGDYQCIVSDDVKTQVSPVSTRSIGATPLPVLGGLGMITAHLALGASLADRTSSKKP